MKETRKRRRHILRRCFEVLVAALFALAFLLPTVLTVSNSFMTETEINANYGLFRRFRRQQLYLQAGEPEVHPG